jgi:hypothetical protein
MTCFFRFPGICLVLNLSIPVKLDNFLGCPKQLS